MVAGLTKLLNHRLKRFELRLSDREAQRRVVRFMHYMSHHVLRHAARLAALRLEHTPLGRPGPGSHPF